jgi:transposase
MEVNADFVDSIYEAVKEHDVYRTHFVGKTIVIVLDNAPAHSQTEGLVRSRSDLSLLRLGPYSPMCNSIEGTYISMGSDIL